MGQLPLCIGSFDPPIPVSQGNNKPSDGNLNCFFDTDKSLLLHLWDEASIRGDFLAHVELHAVFDVIVIQGFREEQESVAIICWSELWPGFFVSADWDYRFHFSCRFFPLTWSHSSENRTRGDSQKHLIHGIGMDYLGRSLYHDYLLPDRASPVTAGLFNSKT